MIGLVHRIWPGPRWAANVLTTVETLTMPGKGKLNITGKLGDVMKESAQAAVSFLCALPMLRTLGIDTRISTARNWIFTVHIPEGAIPKDGPSAGISMCHIPGVSALDASSR